MCEFPKSKFIDTVPSECGRVVGMVTFKDTVLVATERKVFKIVDDKLVPIEFLSESV